MSVPEDDTSTGRSTTPFQQGLGSLAVLLVAITVFGLLNNGLQAWLLGSEPSRIADLLSQVPALVLFAGVTVVLFRREDVSPSDIGLGREKVAPALAAVVAVVLSLNAVVAGLVLVSGESLSVGLFPLYARVLDHTPTVMGVSVAVQYLVVGPVEELAFRGFLQNKVLAVVGTGSRRRTAGGILLAGTVFSTAHLPNIMLQGGVSAGVAAGSLVVLLFSALMFGSVYELTGNLYLVMGLHGLGNYWLLVVDPGTWPNWGVILVVYALLVVAYRQWPATTARPPRPTA